MTIERQGKVVVVTMSAKEAQQQVSAHLNAPRRHQVTQMGTLGQALKDAGIPSVSPLPQERMAHALVWRNGAFHHA